MNVEFQLDWLDQYLKAVAARWPVGPLGDWSPGRRMAILRHDVDLDLEPALRLAQWEQQRSLRASFFVLTTSDCYNPFSKQGQRLLREIQACGGEIGLHLDTGVTPADCLEQVAREDASRLAGVLGREVNTLSLHGPHRLSEIPVIPGFRNAYDPEIFGPGRYISDSSRRFRQDPWEFLKTEAATVQILIHPLHFDGSARDYPEIFAEQLRRWLARVDEEHRDVSEHFRRCFPQPLADDFNWSGLGLGGADTERHTPPDSASPPR
ncbi:MAG: hypothetical protein U0931_23365 [Vulcanimicrobiota bacterium]